MISEIALVGMGFKKSGIHQWTREVEPVVNDKMRIIFANIPRCDYGHAIIEQAEHTGALFEGEGDSDWDWGGDYLIEIKVGGERELRVLVELLETGVVKNRKSVD